MVLRQPITRVWGHQERLLTIARQEVHSHALKCLNLLGRTGGLARHPPSGARAPRSTASASPLPWRSESLMSVIPGCGRYSHGAGVGTWLGISLDPAGCGSGSCSALSG